MHFGAQPSIHPNINRVSATLRLSISEPGLAYISHTSKHQPFQRQLAVKHFGARPTPSCLSRCVLFVAVPDLRGKLCCGVVVFRCAHGGKASKMMICGVCLLQGPGPKSSQVQCAVGDSAKPRQSRSSDKLVNKNGWF